MSCLSVEYQLEMGGEEGGKRGDMSSSSESSEGALLTFHQTLCVPGGDGSYCTSYTVMHPVLESLAAFKMARGRFQGGARPWWRMVLVSWQSLKCLPRTLTIGLLLVMMLLLFRERLVGHFFLLNPFALQWG